MATQAQIDANRRNAQQSTGPQTDAGKAASCQNAYRHGLRASQPIAPGEDREAYVTFALELVEDLQAVGMAQRLIAERIAQLQWKLQRVSDAEFTELEGYRARNIRAMQQATGKIKPPMPPGLLLAGSLGRMMTLQQYETAILRSIDRLHRQLRQLQADAAHRVKDAAKPQATATRERGVENHGAASTHNEPLSRREVAPNLSADQQLEQNWVRSSDSPQGAAPPGSLVPQGVVS